MESFFRSFSPDAGENIVILEGKKIFLVLFFVKMPAKCL